MSFMSYALEIESAWYKSDLDLVNTNQSCVTQCWPWGLEHEMKIEGS